jgi:hypothetical protein
LNKSIVKLDSNILELDSTITKVDSNVKLVNSSIRKVDSLVEQKIINAINSVSTEDTIGYFVLISDSFIDNKGDEKKIKQVKVVISNGIIDVPPIFRTVS